MQDRVKDKVVYRGIGEGIGKGIGFPYVIGGERLADDDPCEFKIVVLQSLTESDPERGVAIILLSNRVNPTRDNPRWAPIRGRIADLVMTSALEVTQ